jgi:serine/threonine protein kinase
MIHAVCNTDFHISRRSDSWILGQLKDQSATCKDRTFDEAIANVEGEEKEMFIHFVKRMIKWNPEDRSTAKELLSDPWLNTEYPQD